ncbi:MAG: pilus assembly protein [Anaerolineales bacterium]
MTLPSMTSSTDRCSQKNSENGSALLEFIYIAPLVFLLIFLVAYVGWYQYAKLSAQNAAYSKTVVAPTTSGQDNVLFGGAAEIDRMDAFILHSDEGFKQMWVDSGGYFFPHNLYGLSRLGGIGSIISISPSDVPYADWLSSYEEFQQTDTVSSNMPKGGSFFFLAPLMTRDH